LGIGTVFDGGLVYEYRLEKALAKELIQALGGELGRLE
jgi:hypothetical protein